MTSSVIWFHKEHNKTFILSQQFIPLNMHRAQHTLPTQGNAVLFIIHHSIQWFQLHWRENEIKFLPNSWFFLKGRYFFNKSNAKKNNNITKIQPNESETANYKIRGEGLPVTQPTETAVINHWKNNNQLTSKTGQRYVPGKQAPMAKWINELGCRSHMHMLPSYRQQYKSESVYGHTYIVYTLLVR